MRNASGLSAADLAHAQGFRECAEMLSNAQNLQWNQNLTQTHLNGFCLNGTTQNGGHSHPLIQGRSLLNGAPNRKRSFDNMETNQIKKARTDGMGLPLGMLNGNGSVCGVGEFLMESIHQESMESAPPAVSSGGPGPLAFEMNGSAPVPGLLDQEQDQGGVEVSTPAPKELEIFTVASMQIPCDPLAAGLGCEGTPSSGSTIAPADNVHHHVYRDTAEHMVATGNAGSQVEHQTSVKAEQQYSH
ncbi:unnamed protein product [Coregonus sp. 'balchen']|nr:unnamed protein product [Coregonus sp. 'balchen']